MFHLSLILILLTFVSSLYAQSICLRELDGQVVYTNLCDRTSKVVIQGRLSPKASTKDEVKKHLSQGYTRESLERLAEEIALSYGLDPRLVKEVIKEESNWNIYATSPKGAMGLMQLMPSTALLLGVRNPYDPKDNIDGGVRYLKYLLEKFNNNLALALAAYNAGPALVETLGRVPNIAETKHYVHRISTRYGKVDLNRERNTSTKKTPSSIRAITLSDGTVLYTNREEVLRWIGK